MVPFSRDAFLAVFADYNVAIWPVQLVAMVVGVLVLIGLARGPDRFVDRMTAVLLAGFWLWTGVAYHLMFFTRINPIAWGFAAAFVLQGLLLLDAGSRASLQFAYRRSARGLLGVALIAYSLVAYPLIGLGFGHAVETLPLFGVTPCPVQLFTVGVLLTARRPPRLLFAIPLAWGVIGGSAALLLDVPQDWALLVAALICAYELLRRPNGARGAPRP